MAEPAVARFDEYLRSVWVDPVEVRGISLFNEVKSVLRKVGIPSLRIWARESKMKAEFDELLRFVEQGRTDFTKLDNAGDVSDPLKEILSQWAQYKIGYQYDRYARYMSVGTLHELQRMKQKRVSEG